MSTGTFLAFHAAFGVFVRATTGLSNTIITCPAMRLPTAPGITPTAAGDATAP